MLAWPLGTRGGFHQKYGPGGGDKESRNSWGYFEMQLLLNCVSGPWIIFVFIVM